MTMMLFTKPLSLLGGWSLHGFTVRCFHRDHCLRAQGVRRAAVTCRQGQACNRAQRENEDPGCRVGSYRGERRGEGLRAKHRATLQGVSESAGGADLRREAEPLAARHACPLLPHH